MNDPRPLAGDVAFLAGALRKLVQMYVLGRVPSQDGERLLLALGVSGPDPQQQAAMGEVLLEIFGVLVADPAGERSPDQTAGAACDRSGGKGAEQGAPDATTARLPAIAGT